MAEEFGEGSELNDVDNKLFAEASRKNHQRTLVEEVVDLCDWNVDCVEGPKGLVISDYSLVDGVSAMPRSGEIRKK